MLLKILRKDFIRKKVITIALFIFIMLSALFVSSGSNIIMELMNSLNELFDKSQTPDFVQMHSGELDQNLIIKWSEENELVQEQQTVEMINVERGDFYLPNKKESEIDSVMDLDFVVQNEKFDYLLDLDSEIIEVSKGQIAIPVYYKQNSNINIGDIVKIETENKTLEFDVVAFVRDSQMNTSLVHSKRFVVNDEDYRVIKEIGYDVEYLIEFLLIDSSKIEEFTNKYQESNLPNKGINISQTMFLALNAISDGIIATVVILVSILLCIIAILCLRFTILSTIEEDYREIGVMKAIGIKKKDIRKIYMVKYIAMSLSASITGFILSLFVNKLFTSNIMVYMGSAPKTLLNFISPFVATLVISLIVVLFCRIILRKFNKISAVEALRSGDAGELKVSKKRFILNKNKQIDVNIFIGLKDVFQRSKMFSLLFLVFIISSFIIIVPINFYNTIHSPTFITYMGVGKSDIRIDIQQTDDIEDRYNNVIESIKKDKDVDKYAEYITCQYEMLDNDGAKENINIETGDFTIFPVSYLKGKAPEKENEIALSYLNSSEKEKEVGDKVILVINNQEKEMVVCGVYQDVTNGGLTAKSKIKTDKDSILNYVISLNVKDGIDVKNKVDEYSDEFSSLRVTDIDDYLSQTLENIVDQLKLITIAAVVIAFFVSILITSLFLKMLVAKDNSQIAIMKSLGLSLKDIRKQYITKALLVLDIGIIIGAVLSNTLGEKLVSGLMSFMGAAKIEFVINPLQAYVLCPIALMIVVSITTILSTLAIKKSSIIEMIVE
ncbi:MAG: FtsX-like permease family protein [Clostridiales bacterium]